MKKLFALALAVSVVGCGPQIELSERPRFVDGVNTITFMLYDALTGAEITDPAATVTITIGTYQLTSTRPDPTSGQNVLIVPQVPPGTHRALITAAGYVSFLGRPTGNCNWNNGNGPSGQCYQTYQVAMFPTASVQSPVTVRAFEETTGVALKSGTAVATLTSVDTLIPVSGWTQLPGTFAERPNSLVVNLTNGAAVFPAADLVMGGTYSVDIYNGVSATDQLLSPYENETFQAGSSYPELTLFMGPPSEYPVALSSSSENGVNHVGAASNFWVKFPYQVEVCSLSIDHSLGFTWGYSDVDADGAFATALPNPFTITPTLENGGTVLTLSPNWEVPPDTGDGHLDVDFYGVRVRAKGSNSCWDLDDIEIRYGSDVYPHMHVVPTP